MGKESGCREGQLGYPIFEQIKARGVEEAGSGVFFYNVATYIFLLKVLVMANNKEGSEMERNRAFGKAIYLFQ